MTRYDTDTVKHDVIYMSGHDGTGDPHTRCRPLRRELRNRRRRRGTALAEAEFGFAETVSCEELLQYKGGGSSPIWGGRQSTAPFPRDHPGLTIVWKSGTDEVTF